MNQPRARDDIFVNSMSPVGKIVHCYHDKAQVEVDDNTKQPKLDTDGIPIAWYKVTLAWLKYLYEVEVGPKGEVGLLPFRRDAYAAQLKKWPNSPNDQWFVLQPFIRDGDNPEHNTARKEYLFGHVYLNFKARAKPIMAAAQDGSGRQVFTGQYSGAPGLTGPYKEDLMPSDVYSGCTARVSCTLFGTNYSGKNFISVRLQNIQKSEDGERMVHGGRPDARSQFDALQPGAPPGSMGGGLGGLGGLPGLNGLNGLGRPAQQPQSGTQAGFGGQAGYSPAQGGQAPQQSQIGQGLPSYQQPIQQPIQQPQYGHPNYSGTPIALSAQPRGYDQFGNPIW